MEKFTVQSTSKYSAKLDKPVIIEETGTTRKILIVDLNDKKIESSETVGITIVHQRRKNKDEWEDVQNIPLSSLKGGEGVKLCLDSSTTRKLYEELTMLYSLVDKEGVQYGTNEFTVSRADKIIQVSNDRKLFIERLLAENFGEEVWKELISSDPDLATKLSLARVQAGRSKSLEIFKQNLESNNSDEAFWQKFFSDNDWIFGYGLNYQFIDLITEQPNYGGTNYTGKGGQKGDFLANTSADSKFTVLVEIKTPTTHLLSYKNDKHKEIRNDVWLLSGELLGAVSQIQVNSITWNRKSQDKENAKFLEQKKIFTVEPKGILVIGNTFEFQNHESKLCCFEIFRRNLHNPEILTFDELYERAKFIVKNQDQQVDEQFDDLPF
jgi:hypothetical protein